MLDALRDISDPAPGFERIVGGSTATAGRVSSSRRCRRLPPIPASDLACAERRSAAWVSSPRPIAARLPGGPGALCRAGSVFAVHRPVGADAHPAGHRRAHRARRPNERVHRVSARPRLARSLTSRTARPPAALLTRQGPVEIATAGHFHTGHGKITKDPQGHLASSSHPRRQRTVGSTSTLCSAPHRATRAKSSIDCAAAC